MPLPADIDSESNAIWYLIQDTGLADEDLLLEVWEQHQRSGAPFVESLYNYGIVEEEQLLWMIADSIGSEYLDLKTVELNDRFMEEFDSQLVRMYEILPISEDQNGYKIAAMDPLNIRLMDELYQVLGKPVEIMVAKPDEILQAIEHFYPEEMSIDASMIDLMGEFEGMENIDEDELSETDLEAMGNTKPIVRFVNVILYQAVKDQASDIHFEPFGSEFKIRYRVDGVLYEMSPPPRHLALPIISRVKVISNLNIAETRKPQDGRVEMRVAGKKIDLRVSTLPTRYGESVVLRVLDQSATSLDLDSLGIPADIKQSIRDVIRKPNGIILVTGPTGSGKTTTLYSCLKEINKVEDKILTCEDPVEYTIEGLVQVECNEGIGMTFAKALKAFLRQDPDRIMVGEIRDLETAGISIEASLTGHMVLSTLHTNDAPSAVTRLTDMGVEPFLITSSVEAVLAQRLVRRVCSFCKSAYEIRDDEVESLELKREELGRTTIYIGKGCKECNSTGYKGRTGLYELFILSPATRDLIIARRPALDITLQARKEGMISLRQQGIDNIFNGITTVEEVLKYT